MGKDPDEIREEIEETRGRMSETVDAIAYKADVPSRMHDAVNDKVDAVKSSIAGTVDNVRSKVTDIASAMPDGSDVKAMTMNTIGSVRENPLGIFFGAAAVGFLLGSLLPATDIENERLGDLSDQLKQTAQNTGGQLLQQGKAVVRDTIEAAKDAATQSAMQHGQEVAQTATRGMQQGTSET